MRGRERRDNVGFALTHRSEQGYVDSGRQCVPCTTVKLVEPYHHLDHKPVTPLATRQREGRCATWVHLAAADGDETWAATEASHGDGPLPSSEQDCAAAIRCVRSADLRSRHDRRGIRNGDGFVRPEIDL